MTINIIATEVDLQNKCEHKRYIRFPLDGGKDFDYRARMSYNAFAHSTKGRCWNGKKFLYACKHEEEFEISENAFKKTLQKFDLKDTRPQVPFVDVNSLFDFYKLIGYDYKTKKYMQA